MNAKPLLSDLQATKIKMSPGDRLLVRVAVDLTWDQARHLHCAISKFVGADVRILFVNCTKMWMRIRRAGQGQQEVLSDIDTIYQDQNPNIANLDCSAVELNKDDALIVGHLQCKDAMEREALRRYIVHWAGPDVEVIVL